MKNLIFLFVLIALVGCSGGGGNGNGEDGNNIKSNKWDEMKWDDGKWGRIQIKKEVNYHEEINLFTCRNIYLLHSI